jgi:hypothetical protein
MGHASPQAVFQAYNEARIKRDWRACYRLLTPEAQYDAVCEMFRSCLESGAEEAIAIVSKYASPNGDVSELDEQPVHGENHRKLLCDYINRRIADKEGFYEEVFRFFVENDPRRLVPFGELVDVIVTGDTAEGCAPVTIFSYSTEGGESRWVPHTSNKTFRFRKINGRWLIDL